MSFVLVPGAGGDAWYWHRVVPLLEERGHTAVAVELPAEDESAGLAEYADAIVAAAGDLRDITLVAQSMGGFSAPLAVDRLDARRLVLVNAMVPAPGETAGAWWENTGQGPARSARAEADGRVLTDEFDVVAEFFHDVPEDVRLAAFSRPEPVQADRPFADPWPLPAWPDVPTSGIAGADDRLFPADFQQRVARERLGLELDVMPGGHLVAYSEPELLVERLLALG
jgi:pimeloyl-ACP methyl ester carboxylesterase